MDIPPEVEMLRNDLVWARHFYNQYKKLYMDNALRVEMLNEIAPSFFFLLKRCFGIK